jgi:hypothetical protein
MGRSAGYGISSILVSCARSFIARTRHLARSRLPHRGSLTGLSAGSQRSSTVFCACARAASDACAGRTGRDELSAGDYTILRAFPVGMDIAGTAALRLLRRNPAAHRPRCNPAIRVETLIHRYFGCKPGSCICCSSFVIERVLLGRRHARWRVLYRVRTDPRRGQPAA